eukprot:CAMPEP_0170558882 /NCGR_PEP_ID=MMETSP0211-20121228/38585_1 /TAXON_ID=311385 /ORGANISM="Pseudokeronopsis sp., Strain OXSARD2" /LENGTH=30 /DNA_ID= /DNA_START= /DNA_END= /DNA_ORIENTATION=
MTLRKKESGSPTILSMISPDFLVASKSDLN